MQAQRLADMDIRAQAREYGSGSTAQMADSGGKLVLSSELNAESRGAKGDKGEKGDRGDKGDTGRRA